MDDIGANCRRERSRSRYRVMGNRSELARETMKLMLRIKSGGVFAMSQCQSTEKACVPVSRQVFTVDTSGFPTAFRISCCSSLAGIHTGSQFLAGCSISYGYRGIPGISVSVNLGQEICE